MNGTTRNGGDHIVSTYILEEERAERAGRRADVPVFIEE
jgi:hypothetical protein